MKRNPLPSSTFESWSAQPLSVRRSSCSEGDALHRPQALVEEPALVAQALEEVVGGEHLLELRSRRLQPAAAASACSESSSGDDAAAERRRSTAQPNAIRSIPSATK